MFEHVGIINLSTYLVGALFIVLLPGPNSLFVLASAASNGIKSGFQAATGVWVGDTILIALMTLGAGSLLQAMPVLFYGLRAVGALYLLYLGLRILWAVFSTSPSAEPIEVERLKNNDKKQRFFARSLALSLVNPKAIFFLLSFFVQFVDPAQGDPWLAFIVLGAFLQLFSVLYLSVLIIGGHHLAAFFRRYTRLAAAANVAVALLFIAFAVRMAFGVA